MLAIARENRRGGHAFPTTPPCSSHAAWLPACLSFYFVAKGLLIGQTTAAAQGEKCKVKQAGWGSEISIYPGVAVWLPSFPRRPTYASRILFPVSVCLSKYRHCQAFECGRTGMESRVSRSALGLVIRGGGEVGHVCRSPPRPTARLTESHRVCRLSNRMMHRETVHSHIEGAATQACICTALVFEPLTKQCAPHNTVTKQK